MLADERETAMKELSTEIEFEGTREEVWEILTDLSAYPAWNPFLQEIEGELRVGARLRVRLQPVDERGITMKPTVRAVEPGRELRWLGHLLVPGSSTGSIDSGSKARPGPVRFVQSERFGGVLVPLMWKRLRAAGPRRASAR